MTLCLKKFYHHWLIYFENILQESEEMIKETSIALAIGGTIGVLVVVIAIAVAIIYRRLIYVSAFS